MYMYISFSPELNKYMRIIKLHFMVWHGVWLLLPWQRVVCVLISIKSIHQHVH